MTTNYKRGYAFEIRVKKVLEGIGLRVYRSGGSHSEADLIAISRLGVVYIVQCKRHGLISVEEWNELFDVAHDYRAVPLLAFIPTGKTQGIEFRFLTGKAEKNERDRMEKKSRKMDVWQGINNADLDGVSNDKE